MRARERALACTDREKDDEKDRVKNSERKGDSERKIMVEVERERK